MGDGALRVGCQRPDGKSECNEFIKHEGLGEASQVCQTWGGVWGNLFTD